MYKAFNWGTGEAVAIKQIKIANLPKSELRMIEVWTLAPGVVPVMVPVAVPGRWRGELTADVLTGGNRLAEEPECEDTSLRVAGWHVLIWGVA